MQSFNVSFNHRLRTTRLAIITKNLSYGSMRGAQLGYNIMWRMLENGSLIEDSFL